MAEGSGHSSLPQATGHGIGLGPDPVWPRPARATEMRTAAAAVAIVGCLLRSASARAGQDERASREVLEARCNAGGQEGPEACYQLALLYHQAPADERDEARARQLAVKACTPNE